MRRWRSLLVRARGQGGLIAALRLALPGTGLPGLVLGAAMVAAAPGAGLSPALAQDLEAVRMMPMPGMPDAQILPADVLQSSAARFPDILASLEREAAAQGDQVRADGAFDLVLSADAMSRLTGFNPGSVVRTRATQPLRDRGAQLYAEYSLSRGTFPPGQTLNFTNELGRVRVGALYSLLRDSAIDARRFGLEDARLASNQASLDVLLTQLGVQFQALQAYWRWVATGRELAVFRDLLAIAEARQSGLERQVARGALPQIALVENQQNILRRQTLVAAAAQRFGNAANALSFFYRAPDGALVTPTPEMLPGPEKLENLPSMADLLDVRLANVVQNRPELRNLKLAIDRARNRVNLRQNDLRPRLDLNVELSRGLGPVGLGGAPFDTTDTVVGVNFSLPLQRREALGQLQRAEAELRELRLREQRAADEIVVQLENILVDLDASLDIIRLARDEVEQAQVMVVAERRKFDLGASDFFVINLREETAADAQVREVRAELTGRLAAASYDAATMNLQRLGLFDPVR